MKLNKRLRKGTDEGPRTLTKEDILDVVKTLIGVRDGHDDVDDIDNLGNRRIRSVGEMVENQFRVGLIRVERTVKDRLGHPDTDTFSPQDFVNSNRSRQPLKNSLVLANSRSSWIRTTLCLKLPINDVFQH